MVDALIKIGFLEIRMLDIIDILLVAIILYQLYRLLKGSLAFSIFLGLFVVFLLWLFVKALNMQLLETLLGLFVDVGVIALLIVFQPEIRRFLLLLGRSTSFKRTAFLKNIFARKFIFDSHKEEIVHEVLIALEHLSNSKTGAIIIFAKASNLQFFANTGVAINGNVSAKLLESIFEKGSPLHDGAVIISEGKIIAANCVLPISENPDLPPRIGMRHRAAVGVTEHSDAVSIVVSEERGFISYSKGGRIRLNVTLNEINKVISKAIREDLH